MADETPTIHIEAVQFTPGCEPVLIHCNVNGVAMIVHTTQTELGWPTDDPEVVASAEAGIKKKIGASLKVKLPEKPPAKPPEAPSL
jgi:hypothetical protein